MSEPVQAAQSEAAAVQRGFGELPCPKCGVECCITLDLDDCEHFNCPECEEVFNVDDVEAIIAAWQPVLAWVRTAPTC